MLIFGAKIQTLQTISQCSKSLKKSHFTILRALIFKKKYFVGFSKIYFAHFWRQNSNIASNITVVQNHSKGLILQICEQNHNSSSTLCSLRHDFPKIRMSEIRLFLYKCFKQSAEVIKGLMNCWTLFPRQIGFISFQIFLIAARLPEIKR